MALSRITQGTAGSFNAGYAVNDVIVILSANLSSSTIPSTPAGYTLLSSSQQSADNIALAIFWKKATSTSETYPTITNSSDSVYAIYTGQDQTTPFTGTGGQSSAVGGSSTISWSGIVSFANPGNDWVLTFAVSTVNGAAMASHPPTAQTLVTNSSNFLAIFDSNAAVSSYSFNSKTLDASSVWLTKTTELAMYSSVVSANVSDSSTLTESQSHYSDQVDVMDRALVALGAKSEESVSDTITVSESQTVTVAVVVADLSVTVTAGNQQTGGVRIV